MSDLGRFPVSWRYLKARLRVLKRRPNVWGAASGVMVVGLLAVFWLASEQPGDRNSADSNSTSGVASLDDLPAQNLPRMLPSAEDSAIGADIDNLPTLLNDLNAPDGSSEAGLGANAEDIPTLPRQPLFSGSGSGNSLVNPSQQNQTEADSSQQNAAGSLGSGASSSGFESSNSPNSSGVGLDIVPDNNLATGSSSNLFNPNARNVEPATTPLESALERNSAADENNLSERSPSVSRQSGISNEQSSPYRTSPPPGTTGYIQPPSLNTPTSNPAIQSNSTYPNFSNSPSAPRLPAAPQIAPNIQQPQSSNTNPNQVSIYPNYYNPPSQPQVIQPAPQITQPEPSNNSVQRSGLGRPIGGGEINTFSNP